MNGDLMKVLGPTPLLIRAMAEFRLGHAAAGNADLNAAVTGFDWNDNSDRFMLWPDKSLRTEAERLAAGGK